MSGTIDEIREYRNLPRCDEVIKTSLEMAEEEVDFENPGLKSPIIGIFCSEGAPVRMKSPIPGIPAQV